MRDPTKIHITWSLLELRGLLEDEDAQVHLERVKKHLGLHPFHLTNLQLALNEILAKNLHTYDYALKGFPIGYRNPKLITPLGEIIHDTCFIHVDVEVDFYIFKPQVNCNLKGIVNKVGVDHIGVLINKAFYVTIPQPEVIDNWPGINVEKDQEIRLTVTQIDVTGNLPFIQGSLEEGEYLRGCRLPAKNVNRKKNYNTTTKTNIKREDLSLDPDPVNGQDNIKQQKKKIRVKSVSEIEHSLASGNISDIDIKTKKRRKEKLMRFSDSDSGDNNQDKLNKFNVAKNVSEKNTEVDYDDEKTNNHNKKERRIKGTPIIKDNIDDNKEDKHERKKRSKASKWIESDTNSPGRIKMEQYTAFNSSGIISDEEIEEKVKLKKVGKKSKQKEMESIGEIEDKTIPDHLLKTSRQTAINNTNSDFENVIIKTELGNIKEENSDKEGINKKLHKNNNKRHRTNSYATSDVDHTDIPIKSEKEHGTNKNSRHSKTVKSKFTLDSNDNGSEIMDEMVSDNCNKKSRKASISNYSSDLENDCTEENKKKREKKSIKITSRAVINSKSDEDLEHINKPMKEQSTASILSEDIEPNVIKIKSEKLSPKKSSSENSTQDIVKRNYSDLDNEELDYKRTIKKQKKVKTESDVYTNEVKIKGDEESCNSNTWKKPTLNNKKSNLELVSSDNDSEFSRHFKKLKKKIKQLADSDCEIDDVKVKIEQLSS